MGALSASFQLTNTAADACQYCGYRRRGAILRVGAAFPGTPPSDRERCRGKSAERHYRDLYGAGLGSQRPSLGRPPCNHRDNQCRRRGQFARLAPTAFPEAMSSRPVWAAFPHPSRSPIRRAATSSPPPAVRRNPHSSTRAFSLPLQVIVKDGSGTPISGATLTFTAPSSGASATLSNATAVTNALGVASVTATANNISGSYSVIADMGGISTSFTLTNLLPGQSPIWHSAGRPRKAARCPAPLAQERPWTAIPMAATFTIPSRIRTPIPTRGGRWTWALRPPSLPSPSGIARIVAATAWATIGCSFRMSRSCRPIRPRRYRIAPGHSPAIRLRRRIPRLRLRSQAACWVSMCGCNFRARII